MFSMNDEKERKLPDVGARTCYMLLCLLALTMSGLCLIRIFNLEQQVESLELQCHSYKSLLTAVEQRVQRIEELAVEPSTLPKQYSVSNTSDFEMRLNEQREWERCRLNVWSARVAATLLSAASWSQDKHRLSQLIGWLIVCRESRGTSVNWQEEITEPSETLYHPTRAFVHPVS